MDGLSEYFKTLHVAGCPKDQAERFIQHGYVATKDAVLFHSLARAADTADGPTDILCKGNRGSAKSHAIISQVCLDDCQRADNLKGLFLRKTQKAAAESFEDLVGKVCRGTPHRLTKDSLEIGKGCKFVIGGYKDQEDLDNYLGLEYDIIVVEERNQIAGEKAHKLKGSCRTSKDYWRPRIYSSTNSGGIGHQTTKRDFGIGKLPTPAKEGHVYVQFDYKHNPFINPEYRVYLEGLSGILAEMWRDDNWDIFAGQAFPEFCSTHVYKHDLPDNWTRFVAMDWGYAKPYAIGCFACDFDGRLWLEWELYGWGGQPDMGSREPPEEVVQRLKAKIGGKKIEAFYAGPDWFAKTQLFFRGRSIAEVFMEVAGIQLKEVKTPAGSRVGTKALMHNSLAIPDTYDSQDATTYPGLMVHERCEHFLRTLPELIYKEGSEDVDTDQEDHSYDMARIMLSTHPWKPQAARNALSQPSIVEKMRQRGLQIQHGGL